MMNDAPSAQNAASTAIENLKAEVINAQGHIAHKKKGTKERAYWEGQLHAYEAALEMLRGEWVR